MDITICICICIDSIDLYLYTYIPLDNYIYTLCNQTWLARKSSIWFDNVPPKNAHLDIYQDLRGIPQLAMFEDHRRVAADF